MEPKMRKMGSFGKYLIFYCRNMRQKYQKLVKMCHQSWAHDWSFFRESWGSCLAHWDRSSLPGATLRSARWWSSSLSLSLYHYHHIIKSLWLQVMDMMTLVNCMINFILYCTMSRQFRTTFRSISIDNIYGLPTNIEENTIIFARLLHYCIIAILHWLT